jgi:hypothetical protein
VGIGIQKTNAGIGIPTSIVTVWYKRKKMPDCVALLRYQTGSGIVSFFQSSTGPTVRHSDSFMFSLSKNEKTRTASRCGSWFFKEKFKTLVEISFYIFYNVKKYKFRELKRTFSFIISSIKYNVYAQTLYFINIA